MIFGPFEKMTFLGEHPLFKKDIKKASRKEKNANATVAIPATPEVLGQVVLGNM